MEILPPVFHSSFMIVLPQLCRRGKKKLHKSVEHEGWVRAVREAANVKKKAELKAKKDAKR